MSSTQQPLFVIYDRQYGNYIRLYGSIPDRFISRDRYTLFDLQQSTSYSGDFVRQPLLLDAEPDRRQQWQPRQQWQHNRMSQSSLARQSSLASSQSSLASSQSSLASSQSSLPKFVADLILRDAATEGKLCPITMEPIEATEAYTVTPCYHAFNKEALGRWTREHSTCPECNQSISNRNSNRNR